MEIAIVFLLFMTWWTNQ